MLQLHLIDLNGIFFLLTLRDRQDNNRGGGNFTTFYTEWYESYPCHSRIEFGL